MGVAVAIDRRPGRAETGQRQRVRGRSGGDQIDRRLGGLEHLADARADLVHDRIGAVGPHVAGVGPHQRVHHGWMRGGRVVRCKIHSGRLLDHVVFPVFFGDLEFRHGPAANRHPGVVHGLGVARDQRMPRVKLFALRTAGDRRRFPASSRRFWRCWPASGRRSQARTVCGYRTAPQRQLSSSSRRQATRVYATSCVSESSSLFRQHLPQPSHSASHSLGVIFFSGTCSQNFGRRPDAVDGVLHGTVPGFPGPVSQSSAIWAISASRLSNFTSGRRKSTSATDRSSP